MLLIHGVITVMIIIVAVNAVQQAAITSDREADATTIARYVDAVYAEEGIYPLIIDADGNFLPDSSTVSLPDNIKITEGTSPISRGTAAEELDVKTYAVELCLGGAEVYYWDELEGEAKTVKAGSGCQR